MSHVYEFGSFRLDPQGELLTRDGQKLHLAAKSYLTLLFLVERAGAMVSKDELLGKVWPDGFVEPANLTQTIYVLRKTLSDGNGEIIETVPSRGYRFTAPVRVVERTSNGAPHRTRPRAVVYGVVSALAMIGIVLVATAFLSERKNQVTTRNPQALRDYILGRHYWSERTIPDLKVGLHYFRAALAIDPTFAQAYSGVADSYAMLGYYGMPDRKSYKYFDLARVAALRAVALDPTVAESHASLAFADEMSGKTHFPQATAEFERSIQLDGRYATAREWFSWFLFYQHKPKEALAQMSEARNLDPTSPAINYALGSQLFFLHRFKDASDLGQLVISLQPSSEQSYFSAGLADEQVGQTQRAVREFKRALAIAPGDPDALGALAHVYAQHSQPEIARRMLAQIVEAKPTPAYDIAMVKAALGQRDDANRWLALAKKLNDANLWLVDVDPRMVWCHRSAQKSSKNNA